MRVATDCKQILCCDGVHNLQVTCMLSGSNTPRHYFGNMPRTPEYVVPRFRSILLVHVGLMSLSDSSQRSRECRTPPINAKNNHFFGCLLSWHAWPVAWPRMPRNENERGQGVSCSHAGMNTLTRRSCRCGSSITDRHVDCGCFQDPHLFGIKDLLVCFNFSDVKNSSWDIQFKQHATIMGTVPHPTALHGHKGRHRGAAWKHSTEHAQSARMVHVAVVAEDAAELLLRAQPTFRGTLQPRWPMHRRICHHDRWHRRPCISHATPLHHARSHTLENMNPTLPKHESNTAKM